jgi:electron-transferring-flavoprotein dehydrogenase
MAATTTNGHAPAEFPPPVDTEAEFIAAPQAGEDEAIEVGVAIVGGGPAGLAAANRLLQLLADDEELQEQLGEVPVAVIEKAKTCGGHNLSGAVMKPGPLKSLFPDEDLTELPAVRWVNEKDDVWWLTEKGTRPMPGPTPPNFQNEGNWVTSISQLCRWMAEKAEESGAYILTETAAAKLLVQDGAVQGIVTGDKGRGKEGEELGNFEPGMEVHARHTVLAEGNWGHLTGAAIKHFDLAQGAEPPVWKLGAKEVWKTTQQWDKVVHFFGWPGRSNGKWHETGVGGWVYPYGENLVSIGIVVPLATPDATVSAHDMLQTVKQHPKLRAILEGGERTAWGAKAIQGGGFWSQPKLSMPGAVLVGESGGMIDMASLKGVHMAIQSGIIAAEEIYKSLKLGQKDVSSYETAIADSEVVGKRLFQVRNNMQLVGGSSMPFNLAKAGLDIITKGKIPGGRKPNHRDAEVVQFVPEEGKRASDLYPKPDGKYTFDKLSSVFITGNATRDDAPSHIRIEKNVAREVAETWKWMCPAGVYEIPEDAPETGHVDVIVNYTNCVQCGAITARGGRLTPPEGGDGPAYQVV